MFHTYIVRTLHALYPNIKISKQAVDVLNTMCLDVLENLGTESMTLMRRHGTQTLSAKEIATATRLCFPGDLSKYAIEEAEKSFRMSEGRADDEASFATDSAED